MRMVNAVCGLAVALTGLVAALWAPPVFEMFIGRPLPAPVGTDELAMTIWAGVAFLRVFGAAVFTVGAVVYAMNTGSSGSLRIRGAVVRGSGFATLMALAQQTAIWDAPIGWLVVGMFLALAIVSGRGLLGPKKLSVATRSL